MAFECQKNTQVHLSKNSVHSLGYTCEQEVEFDQIRPFSSDPKVLTPDSKTNAEEESGKPEPISGSHSKSASTASYGAKFLPFNGVLSNHCHSITDLPLALISEIFNCLDPKDLGTISCVSMPFHRLASEHKVWKEFYCERWGLPMVPKPQGSGYSDEKSWKELFVERVSRSRTFMGRYRNDALYGHTEAVRTVFLLASKKLIFTSGYDSIIRMWSMEEGVSIAKSRPLGCTIRAVVADTKLLVAGGTDGFIHGWRAEEGLPYLFNLEGAQNQRTEFRLWEHVGPITCLALDLTRIYSGSWDMTVRVWDRSLLKCLKVLRHNDWVWSLVPHNTTVASASGSDVYVWETDTETQIAVINNVHVGNTYSLARSHTGNLLFSGGEDGGIHMYEISSYHNESSVKQVATWIPHLGPVYSLAFEFPWLVSASSDGKLSLIDVRKLLKLSRNSSMERSATVNYHDQKGVEPPQRMLHGFGCNLFSVGIGNDRIICGGEEGVVRILDFSKALEIERRRLENKMRRRKLQIDRNNKIGGADQCSVAAKNNLINGDRNVVWHNKRGLSGKLRA